MGECRAITKNTAEAVGAATPSPRSVCSARDRNRGVDLCRFQLHVTFRLFLYWKLILFFTNCCVRRLGWATMGERAFYGHCARVHNSLANAAIWSRRWFARYSRKHFRPPTFRFVVFYHFWFGRFRLLHRLPAMNVLPFEHSDVAVYDKAHRKGRSKEQCETAYPECSFSLIELALGHYSAAYNFVWNKWAVGLTNKLINRVISRNSS